MEHFFYISRLFFFIKSRLDIRYYIDIKILRSKINYFKRCSIFFSHIWNNVSFYHNQCIIIIFLLINRRHWWQLAKHKKNKNKLFCTIIYLNILNLNIFIIENNIFIKNNIILIIILNYIVMLFFFNEYFSIFYRLRILIWNIFKIY